MDGGEGGGQEGFLENKAVGWWEGLGRDRKERIEDEASQERAARHLVLQSSCSSAQKQRRAISR